MTRQLAVLGSPISHSKSPIIHSAAYRVLGLDWEYSKFEVRKGGLSNFLSGLDENWLGLSLTMPLKEEAAVAAVNLDEAAQLTGAVNTLLKVNQSWHGFNTDVFGIVQAVQSANLGNIASVLIIGSGATATSAVAAVKIFAPEAEVSVFARNPVTRGLLVDFAQQIGLKSKVARRLRGASLHSDLVIATLPAKALDDSAKRVTRIRGFNPRGAILDVAYDPWPSKFASLWQSKGQPIISGFEMLLWQAVGQIRIFTSSDPNQALPNEVAVVAAMRHALEA